MVFLIIIIIAVANSNAHWSTLPDWVLIAGMLSFYTLPLGFFLVALGLRLKNKAGRSVSSYGFVIGTGAALMISWLWFWGVALFRLLLIG
jgi:hypothetical protein